MSKLSLFVPPLPPSMSPRTEAAPPEIVTVLLLFWLRTRALPLLEPSILPALVIVTLSKLFLASIAATGDLLCGGAIDPV